MPLTVGTWIKIALMALLTIGIGVGVVLSGRAQLFKSKANLDISRIEFVGTNIVDGKAISREIQVKLTFVPPVEPSSSPSQEPVVNPSPVESPSPSLTPTPSPDQASPTPIPIATPVPTPSPSSSPSPTPSSVSAPVVSSTKLNKKVMVLSFDPYVALPGETSRKLSGYKGWNNWNNLSQALISAMRTISGGMVEYSIASYQDIDSFNTKVNGFEMTPNYYLTNCLVASPNDNCRAFADYNMILEKYQVCEKRNSGEIDEVWFFGGPWFGYYESNLAGPNGFWYNSTPTSGTSCQKLLPIMGFNYERGVAEMLHDYGHRLESTMDVLFANSPDSVWAKFKTTCGTTHYPFNTTTEYDYTNQTRKESTCDYFKTYPNLTGQPKTFSCSTWGCNQEGYFYWLFSKIPKFSGKTGDVYNNWWSYFIDPQSYVVEKQDVLGVSIANAQAVFPSDFRLSNTREGLETSETQILNINEKVVNWQLTEGNGPKTVYGQFKIGGVWGNVLTASITLEVPAGAQVEASPEVSAVVSASPLQDSAVSPIPEASATETLATPTPLATAVPAASAAVNVSPSPSSSQRASPTPTPATSSTPKPSVAKSRDFNKDGIVNSFDQGLFLTKFNKTVGIIDYDLNSDGTINSLDYTMFLQGVGQSQ